MLKKKNLKKYKKMLRLAQKLEGWGEEEEEEGFSARCGPATPCVGSAGTNICVDIEERVGAGEQSADAAHPRKQWGRIFPGGSKAQRWSLLTSAYLQALHCPGWAHGATGTLIHVLGGYKGALPLPSGAMGVPKPLGLTRTHPLRQPGM